MTTLPYERAPLDVRFWKYVQKGEGCWEWTGTRHARGYGTIRDGGKMRRANRVSWELHNGPIPPGLVVRHSCDNPRCVRPDHLLLGTQKDNMADMNARARRNPARGDRNSRTKLSDAQVAEIRRRHVFRVVTYDMLAAEYGVATSTVAGIVRGRDRKAASTKADAARSEPTDQRQVGPSACALSAADAMVPALSGARP